MNGQKLRQLVKSSGQTADVIAKKLGIGRQHLYNLYEKEDIGGEYFKKVESIGLLKYDTERQKDDNQKSGLSATKWMEMWENAEKERREVMSALLQFIDSHNKLLASHDQLMSTHQNLLKTKLKISS